MHVNCIVTESAAINGSPILLSIEVITPKGDVTINVAEYINNLKI
jgi:hypothetical protein